MGTLSRQTRKERKMRLPMADNIDGRTKSPPSRSPRGLQALAPSEILSKLAKLAKRLVLAHTQNDRLHSAGTMLSPSSLLSSCKAS